MRKIGNRKAVSAVVGVILMVSITIAIACTVYVYVSGMVKETELDGYITDKTIFNNTYSGGYHLQYYFVIDIDDTIEVTELEYNTYEIGDLYPR